MLTQPPFPIQPDRDERLETIEMKVLELERAVLALEGKLNGVIRTPRSHKRKPKVKAASPWGGFD